MNFARYVVAAALLLFAWKGAILQMEWPPRPLQAAAIPKPAPELLVWAKAVQPILPKMLPSDRKYLANFYDAMAFVLMRDGDRAQPIVSTTEKWVTLHSSSLNLAIERASVGRYPGLGEAIDEAFFSALGADVQSISPEARRRLVAACGVLSWTFSIHRDE